MNAPIIFCHYGNSEYLPYVFEAAKTKNPDKEIILLGDKDNQWLGKNNGVRHYLFHNFSYGREIETFDQVYRLVQGKKHNNIRKNKDWVNFVFKRWFYIYNFVSSQNINDFWHFDSDNMILSSLKMHEEKFKLYDCTEQCDGACMNGYISNPLIVFKYINKINELFQNRRYLEMQEKEFTEVNSNFAFTEMRAYVVFKEEENINSIRLNSIIDGSAFDDCICQEHNMEMETIPFGRKIKKIYCNLAGDFYCTEKNNAQPVKMNSLNLSWVPTYLFKVILLQLKENNKLQKSGVQDITKMSTISQLIWGKYFMTLILRKNILR